MDSTRQTQIVDRGGCVPAESSFDLKQRTIMASKEAGVGPEFREWLDANWPLWMEFCRLADLMRNKGRQYYSARAVLHVLRWHRHLSDALDAEFKINNNWSAKMARTYNRMHGIAFFRERG